LQPGSQGEAKRPKLDDEELELEENQRIQGHFLGVHGNMAIICKQGEKAPDLVCTKILWMPEPIETDK
jgi:hypothetical protein